MLQSRFCIIWLILVGALLWGACGQRSLLRRADRLDKKATKLRALAVAKGAKLTTDTVWAPVSVKSPVVNFEFRPQLPLAKIYQDTVLIYSKAVKNAKEPAKIKIQIQRDTITKIELYCPEQDIKIKAPVKVENKYEVRPKYNFWDGLVLGLILGVAGIFLVILKGRQRRE